MAQVDPACLEQPGEHNKAHDESYPYFFVLHKAHSKPHRQACAACSYFNAGARYIEAALSFPYQIALQLQHSCQTFYCSSSPDSFPPQYGHAVASLVWKGKHTHSSPLLSLQSLLPLIFIVQAVYSCCQFSFHFVLNCSQSNFCPLHSNDTVSISLQSALLGQSPNHTLLLLPRSFWQSFPWCSSLVSYSLTVLTPIFYILL